jgi:hypothetical protein
MRYFCIKQLGKRVLDLFKDNRFFIHYLLLWSSCRPGEISVRRTHLVKVYFFQVDGCARHLRNPATKCDLPIG